VGGSPIIPVTKTDTQVIFITTPHGASPNNPIILFDIDNAAPQGTTVPGGGFTYNLSRVRQVCLTAICLARDATGFVYFVGPSEGIVATNLSYTNQTGPSGGMTSCFQPTVIPQAVNPVPSNLQFLSVFTLGTGCGTIGTCQVAGTYTTDINFSLANSGAPANTNLTLNGLLIRGVSCTK